MKVDDVFKQVMDIVTFKNGVAKNMLLTDAGLKQDDNTNNASKEWICEFLMTKTKMRLVYNGKSELVFIQYLTSDSNINKVTTKKTVINVSNGDVKLDEIKTKVFDVIEAFEDTWSETADNIEVKK